MSTTQVTQVAQTYQKYVRYEARWATGRLGFKPIVEKQEIVLRRKCPTKLVLVYESEYQPRYSRTYNSLVLLVHIKDEEKKVQKLMKKLMELELSTEEIIKFVCKIIEHDVRIVKIDEDYEYYKRITIILK